MKRQSMVEILGVRVHVDGPGPGEFLPPRESTGSGGLSAILLSWCEKYGYTAEFLCGPRRYRKLVEARRQFSLAARRSGYSYPEIGRALCRNHCSIMHLVSKK